MRMLSAVRHLCNSAHICCEQPSRGFSNRCNCPTSPILLQCALFPGDSEVQQLLHIFKLLGTPSEEVWPGLEQLRDWHEFPQWKPQPLHRIFPTLDAAGVDLLGRMFVYDPAKRISVSLSLTAFKLSPILAFEVCTEWPRIDSDQIVPLLE